MLQVPKPQVQVQVQVPDPQVQVQVLESQVQVQVQVLKSNYQVQHKYQYRYVINKRIKQHLKSKQTVTRHRQS